MASSIPTRVNPRRVDLAGGGFVTVCRVRGSVKAACAEYTKARPDDVASLQRYQMLLARAGILAGEGLTDLDTGETFAVSHAKVGGVGHIATARVGDAIPAEDLPRLLAIITGDGQDEGDGGAEPLEPGSELTGAQAGN